MPIHTWSSVILGDTDANFTAWAQGVSDAFNALLVKTADTGQAAQPFVFARPAANAVVGFEVFRFDDAQQALFPIYMKVEYGFGSSLNTPTLYVTWGTGTDGNGGITGVRLGRQAFNRSNQPGSGVITENGASAGEGYFNLFWGGSGADGLGLQLSVGRSIDVLGDPTADAYWAFSWNGNAVNFFTVPPAPLAALVRSTNAGNGAGLPVLGVPESTNSAEYVSMGGEVPVYPIEPFLGRRQPPLKSAAMVNIGDVGPGVVFQTLMFGETLTFRRVAAGSNNFVTRGGMATNALAIRWE